METRMPTNDIYLIIREAIQEAWDRRDRSYEVGHEAHYMALAAVEALKKAGYSIEKKVDA
jgi:hypothetical protein